MVWAYLDGGAEDERTLRANRDAFTHWCLRQRVLAGFDEADISATVAGQPLDLPVLLAPTGLTGLAHASGELAAAQAAERAGTRLVLSTASSYSIEEVADGTNDDHWFQLYPWGEGAGSGASLSDSMLDRARDAGYRTLVVTVDVPAQGNCTGERRTGMGHPPILTPRRIADAAIRPRWWWGLLRQQRMTMRSLTHTRGAAGAIESVTLQERRMRPNLTWPDVGALRERWDGPFLVKGVLEPDDAITAQALGADAVLIGRPYLYGLAVGGADGVAGVLAIFAEEIRKTLLLMGITRITDLGREHLVPAR